MWPSQRLAYRGSVVFFMRFYVVYIVQMGLMNRKSKVSHRETLFLFHEELSVFHTRCDGDGEEMGL